MDPVLSVHGLKTHFFTCQGRLRAVDGVDFHMDPMETLGLLGESGCGKSVTARSIMRLISEPGKIVDGKILFEGRDLLTLSQKEMRKIRGNKISMIFQDPTTSLNPVFTIENQISEVIELHQKLSKKESQGMTVELLRRVGIPSPAMRMKDYPHQLSGGMRQRAMIAMALACRPTVLIADEPTTALDVTIQAQILILMRKLKVEIQTAILFITHNLAILSDFADRLLVMYAGKIVEEGSTKKVIADPQHPYTQGLLRSIPQIELDASLVNRRLVEIPGAVPDLRQLPQGCTFHPRCPQAMKICREAPPEPKASAHSTVRCWLYG